MLKIFILLIYVHVSIFKYMYGSHIPQTFIKSQFRKAPVMW